MAPWEPFVAPPLLRRPNTGSQWVPAPAESPWASVDGFAPSNTTGEPQRFSLYEGVQRSPQRCSQAFRSSQSRFANLQSVRSGDPRQLRAAYAHLLSVTQQNPYAMTGDQLFGTSAPTHSPRTSTEDTTEEARPDETCRQLGGASWSPSCTACKPSPAKSRGTKSGRVGFRKGPGGSSP